jgi:hypothetical protein
VTLDDSRIQKLRAEVLGQLDAARTPGEAAGLEARVAALEAAVAALSGSRPGAAPGAVPLPSGRPSHASLQVLGPGGAQGDRCLMEPDKPCVQSHACRTFGH